jgi:4-amino-4-deoxy-L-arabinose transferase-like glycosyltransferase
VKALLIALLAAAVLPFFVKLGDASIWDANEAYYVETPREMIESGDYVNPSFNYEPRFNKPVLSYWIVAGLYRIFGVSVAVERVAIAAAAMLMIAAAFLLARAASIQPLAPLIAALGVAVGPRFFMFSRRILVDMAVTAMMTLTLLFFALAERYPAHRRLFLVLMYVSVGLGVLTKGPVAAVIPLIVFAVYLAVHRELGRLREMMIPAGTLIALAIAAPWYVALYLQHGWTHITGFFIGENVGRFTETVGVQARGVDFYLPVVVTDTLPWSLCLPAAIVAWRGDAGRGTASLSLSEPAAASARRIRTLLLLWIAITVGLFSLSQTKQDLYIFPIVTAVAALGGDLLARAFDRAGPVEAAPYEHWLKGTLTLLGVAMVLLGAGVLFIFGGERTIYATDGAQTSGLIAVMGGLVVMVVPWWRRYRAAVCTALAVFIAFNWILAVRTLPSFERYKPVVPLSEVIRQRATADDIVAHYDVALPSMVFYLRRHIDIWFDPEGFASQIRADRRVFAVLGADRYEGLKNAFGVPTCIVARHPTADVRLRTLLERQSPPEVLVITNRCPPS